MKLDWTQDDQFVHIELHTHTLKTVQVQFNERDLQIEMCFKNRIPEKETFAMRLSDRVIPNGCRHQFQRETIKLTLKKVEPNHWTDAGQVSQESNLQSKKPKKKTLDTNEWERLLRETEAENGDNEKDPSDVFKQLYDFGDDNARRAMIKSFTESNGTVLSMNWGEVQRDKVQPYDK